MTHDLETELLDSQDNPTETNDLSDTSVSPVFHDLEGRQTEEGEEFLDSEELAGMSFSIPLRAGQTLGQVLLGDIGRQRSEIEEVR